MASAGGLRHRRPAKGGGAAAEGGSGGAEEAEGALDAPSTAQPPMTVMGWGAGDVPESEGDAQAVQQPAEGGEGWLCDLVLGVLGALFTAWAVAYLYWHATQLIAAEDDPEVLGQGEPWYFSWFTSIHQQAAEQEVQDTLYRMGYREK